MDYFITAPYTVHFDLDKQITYAGGITNNNGTTHATRKYNTVFDSGIGFYFLNLVGKPSSEVEYDPSSPPPENCMYCIGTTHVTTLPRYIREF